MPADSPAFSRRCMGFLFAATGSVFIAAVTAFVYPGPGGVLLLCCRRRESRNLSQCVRLGAFVCPYNWIYLLVAYGFIVSVSVFSKKHAGLVGTNGERETRDLFLKTICAPREMEVTFEDLL